MRGCGTSVSSLGIVVLSALRCSDHQILDDMRGYLLDRYVEYVITQDYIDDDR